MWNPYKTSKHWSEGTWKGCTGTIIAGLDVGTSRTAAVIASVESGLVRLLGTGLAPTVGVRRGIIADPGLAAMSIRQALALAEEMAGRQVSVLYSCHNGINVSVKSYLADTVDRNYVLLEAVNNKALYNKAVSAPAVDIEALSESIKLAGLNLSGVIYGPLAGAGIILTGAEREFGTILVELGAGVTSVSVFEWGSIRHTAVMPVGGEHLVGDLAVGLRISYEQAAQLLEEYMSIQEPVHPGQEDMDNFGQLRGREGKQSEDKLYTRTSRIIEARLGEMFELVLASLNSFNYPGLLPGGAVLYGGVSNLSGIVRLASEKLGLPVRKGQPEAGLLACFSNYRPFDSSYTNSAGLIKYVYTNFMRGNRRKKAGRKSKHDPTVRRD